MKGERRVMGFFSSKELGALSNVLFQSYHSGYRCRFVLHYLPMMRTEISINDSESAANRPDAPLLGSGRRN